MYVPFDQLPSDARLWVYGINRTLTDQEATQIQEQLKAFLAQWTAHQQTLEASCLLPYNAFLILALNENRAAASGCSIDASVHFLKHLEQDFQVRLFDRTLVTYKRANKIEQLSLAEFKTKAKEGSITASTVVFNNLVETKEAFESAWETPASLSWHNRFL